MDTAIYTLRKSPVDGAGIKLVHAGRQAVYGQSTTNHPSPETILNRVEGQRFNLTPDERAAHDRAVEALKQKQP